MYFDFPTILVVLTLFTGFFWLLDVAFLRRRRHEAAGGAEVKEPMVFELSRSFFPVFLIVVVVRSFMIEPFRIPSGSMMPTLLIGDFILVNKFAYGLRLPVLETKVLDLGEPKRGDVVVFRFPENPRMDYIKRVVAVPGDEVDYREKAIYINGEPYAQTPIGIYQGFGSGERFTGYFLGSEKLDEVEHRMMVHPMAPNLAPSCRVLQNGPVRVPQGKYFVMGDNRDNSNDSRCWGFVPETHLRGRAMAIWMNWDTQRSGIINWERIGQIIN